MGYLQRFGAFYKQNGLRPTILRFGAELGRARYCGRMVYFSCSLPVQESRANAVTATRVRGQRLSEEDREQILQYGNRLLRNQQFTERLAIDCDLWLAKVEENRLAGFGWTIRGRTLEPYVFPLAEDDAHLFDFFVFPEFRGRGVNVAFVESILESLGSQGVRRALIEVAAWNKAQLRSLTKTSFCKYAEAIKWTARGRSIVFWLSHGL